MSALNYFVTCMCGDIIISTVSMSLHYDTMLQTAGTESIVIRLRQCQSEFFTWFIIAIAISESTKAYKSREKTVL